jgi:hypothetical protein
MAPPKTIILGGGVAGIAMAHALKCTVGYENFEVSEQPFMFFVTALEIGSMLATHITNLLIQIHEKLSGLGGTWKVNSYPGWYVVVWIQSPNNELQRTRSIPWLTPPTAALMFQFISTLSASTSSPTGPRPLPTKRRFFSVSLQPDQDLSIFVTDPLSTHSKTPSRP